MFSEIPKFEQLSVNEKAGVTEVFIHSDGGPFVWNARIHRELTELFAWLSFDETTSVLILSGTGDRYCTEIDSTELRNMSWRQIWSEGRRLLAGILDLEMLVISVVNGPALIHSEIAVMADIVLACPEAECADNAHFLRKVVPGDGVQLVWARLLGSTRASYFLLTGSPIKANEALRLGVVHEIHPREALLSRARELACQIADKGPALARYTRAALRATDRRHFREDLSYGFALEGLAQHALGFRSPESP
jgi:enoyl-CoA hydratase/carnithine racemase